MLPPAGGTMPEIVLNSVVLPAPFGPTMATNWPASTDERHVGQRAQAAIGDARGRDLKHRAATHFLPR